MSIDVMDIKTEIKTEPTDFSIPAYFDEKPNVVKFENDMEIKSESIDDNRLEAHNAETEETKYNIFVSPLSCGKSEENEVYHDTMVQNEVYHDTMMQNSNLDMQDEEIDTAQCKLKKCNPARCVCNVCHKSFYDRRTFLEHINIHRGIRPYVCDVCQASYTHRSTLRTHKLSHSEERAYVCDVCQKSFVTLKNLKTHAKLHKEVKRYVCIGCNKTFKNAKNLRTHVSRICTKLYERMQNSTQSGERPYVCEKCNTSFSDADCLEMHKFVRRHDVD